jgi:hypothetical protein
VVGIPRQNLSSQKRTDVEIGIIKEGIRLKIKEAGSYPAEASWCWREANEYDFAESSYLQINFIGQFFA